MRVRLAALVTTAVLVGFPALAGAVTIRDIIELSRAGLSPQVLVALIQTDGSRFDLEPSQILELRAEGVPDEVIIAMLRTGGAEQQPQRQQLPPVDAAQPSRDGERPMMSRRGPRTSRHGHLRSRFVSIPIPLFVPSIPLFGFQGSVMQGHIPASFDTSQFSSFGTGFTSCLSSGSCLLSPGPVAEPIYWGWGGKRRPDTWEQPAATGREK